jgi:hypothetical protein
MRAAVADPGHQKQQNVRIHRWAPQLLDVQHRHAWCTEGLVLFAIVWHGLSVY